MLTDNGLNSQCVTEIVKEDLKETGSIRRSGIAGYPDGYPANRKRWCLTQRVVRCL